MRGTRERAQQLKNQAVHGINLTLTGYRAGLSRMSPISAAGTREEMGTTKWGRSRMSKCAFTQPQPSSGHRVTELSWLQQQQDKLLHGVLVQRPLALPGALLAMDAQERLPVCLQKEPGNATPGSRIKSLHRSRHPHCKEMSRAVTEKV